MVRSKFGRSGALAVLAVGALGLTGCNNALEGGISGAAGGALVGLGIGALSGNEGDGAAIGALSGAALGSIIGDQNRRNAEYNYGRGYGGGGYYYERQDYYQPRYRGRESYHYTPYCD